PRVALLPCVAPAGGGAAAPPGEPAGARLRRAGLGRADPVRARGPAHAPGPGPAVVLPVPRDQRPHLRGRPGRPRGALVLLPGRGPAGAGAGRPLDLRPALHVVTDGGGERRAPAALTQPPPLAA